MKNYNQVYGQFSSGTGNWLDDKLFSMGIDDPYSEIIIDSYVTQVHIDLNRLSPLICLKDKIVMDVGTGRQALALNKLGAKFVDHFDISKSNIKLFNQYLNKNKLKISSEHTDISAKTFVTKKRLNRYHCIYLQGIIQHVENPGQALNNISAVCRNDGIVWLYHYQCGSTSHLYWEAIRFILGPNSDISAILTFLKMLKFSDKNINIIMDNIGCTYRHLLSSQFYAELMYQNGFEQIMDKDIYNPKDGLNLRITTPACIGGYKKVKGNVVEDKIMLSSKHIDHFDEKNFRKEDRKLIKMLSVNFNQIKTSITVSRKKLSTFDLLSIALPLIIEVVDYRVNSPFIIIKNNLLGSFKKSLEISRGMKIR